MYLPCGCYADQRQLHVSFNKFCMLHPRSNHAPCTRKLYQLIPHRRHLPVPHSGINRRSHHPGHAHGHIPAARPSKVKGITAPGRSPKARDTRQYEESTQTLDCCRMRLTRIKRARRNAVATLLAKRRQGRVAHVVIDDLRARGTCLLPQRHELSHQRTAPWLTSV